MDLKHLKTAIEDAFLGTIAFLYGYATAQFRILKSPVRGALQFIRLNQSSGVKEIGPYSCLFTSLLLSHFIVISGLSLQSAGNQIRDAVHSLMRAGFWVWAVASFATVVVLDLLLQISAAQAFARDERRRNRFIQFTLYVLSPLVLVASPILVFVSWLSTFSVFEFGLAFPLGLVGVVLAGAIAVMALGARGLSAACRSLALARAANFKPPTWLLKMPRWMFNPQRDIRQSWFAAAMMPLCAGIFACVADFAAGAVQGGDIHIVRSYCDMPPSSASPVTGFVVVQNDRVDDMLIEQNGVEVRVGSVEPVAVRLTSDGEARNLPAYILKAGEAKLLRFESQPVKWSIADNLEEIHCSASVRNYWLKSLGIH